MLAMVIIIIQGFCHLSRISETLQALERKSLRLGENSVLEKPGLWLTLMSCHTYGNKMDQGYKDWIRAQFSELGHEV